MKPKPAKFKTCKCKWCTVWSPIIKRIDHALSPRLKKQFNDLLEHYIFMEEDYDYLQAKMDGSWPGWEWLPNEIKKHQK